jgi:hypothetical protein
MPALNPGKLEPDKRIIPQTHTIFARGLEPPLPNESALDTCGPSMARQRSTQASTHTFRDRSERRGAEDAHFAEFGSERILENHGRFREEFHGQNT